VAVVVFDADVLIAFLSSEDAHHDDAVKRMRKSLEPGTRRLVCAVNYGEVLIGPLQAGGPKEADKVDAMFARLAMETIQVDMALAQRAAAVRVRTKLKLPDAYAIATAMHAERHLAEEVRIESFDRRVLNAYRRLRAADPV
jgi:predicted nucleic acid-binding protein